MPVAAANSVGVFIPPSLHRANPFATEKVCCGGNAFSREAAHYASMDERWVNFIAAWRTKKGWTQDQLADAIGTTKGTVSQYESGKRKPSQERLREIAKALDTTPGALLDGAPPRAAIKEMPSDRVTSLFERVSANRQDLVLQLLEQLAGPEDDEEGLTT